MDRIYVNVQSGWASKINWTQIVAFIAILAAMMGFDLKPEDQAVIVSGIAALAQVVTVILRVFFTSSVTPKVATKLNR